MAEYNDQITYRIKIDPSEAHREAQKALENEKAKGAAPGRPSSGPASHFTAPIDQPVQTAAEQEREKMRVHRLSSVAERIVTAPSMADRIVTSASGTSAEFGKTQNQNTASRLTGTPAAQRANAHPPQNGVGQVLDAVKPFISHVVPHGHVNTAHRIISHLSSAFGRVAPVGEAAPIAPALGGAGSGAAMGAGLAAAGGIAAAVALSVANIASATSRLGSAVNNQLGGAVNANGSQIIKGYVQQVGSGLQLAMGPLGLIVSPVVDRFTKLIDVADQLADRWAKFNAQIAGSQMQLQATIIAANIRMANAMAPALAQWNIVKGNLVSVSSRLVAFAGGILSTVITPLEMGASMFLRAVDKLLTRLGIGGPVVQDTWLNLLQGLTRATVGMPNNGAHVPNAANKAVQGLIDRSAAGFGPMPTLPLPPPVNALPGGQKPPLVAPSPTTRIPPPPPGVDPEKETEQDRFARWYKHKYSDLYHPMGGMGSTEAWKLFEKDAAADDLKEQQAKAAGPKRPVEPVPPKSVPMKDLDINAVFTQNVQIRMENMHDLLASQRDASRRMFDEASRFIDEARLGVQCMVDEVIYSKGVI